ncbi:MAG: sugar phosphate isomerase/epimerase, partial [Anaerolineae bacterium]|nr:sugar phosphate isomerase/epimerase [Anaerolineae bacterium]
MFRVGTTSYIVPDNILPNVEYLAPLVDDVELVLFETD